MAKQTGEVTRFGSLLQIVRNEYTGMLRCVFITDRKPALRDQNMTRSSKTMLRRFSQQQFADLARVSPGSSFRDDQRRATEGFLAIGKGISGMYWPPWALD